MSCLPPKGCLLTSFFLFKLHIQPFSFSSIHLLYSIIFSDRVYRSLVNKPTIILLFILRVSVRGTSLSRSPPQVFLSNASPIALIKQCCHGDAASRRTGVVGRDIPSNRNFNYDLSLPCIALSRRFCRD